MPLGHDQRIHWLLFGLRMERHLETVGQETPKGCLKNNNSQLIVYLS
jgi:hypothetical protein